MDKVDLKIISELEINSRYTNSNVAKKLKTSPQRIKYRIENLEKNNIITGFYTLINFGTFGYTSYRTMIRFTNIDSKIHSEIIKYLIENENILWMVETGGRWDLLVNFMVQSPIEFDIAMTKLKTKFPDQIQNYDVLITLRGIYFGKNYLIHSKNKLYTKSKFELNTKIKILNETEKKVLSILSQNARANVVDIARKTNLAVNTVISNMKNLETENIIAGYKPQINLNKIQYFAYKLLIKFQNMTVERENELISYLQKYPNITGILKLIGVWDFEIEIELKSYEQLIEISRQIREEFKDIIKDFEILPLYKEYPYNYFPKKLLSE